MQASVCFTPENRRFLRDFPACAADSEVSYSCIPSWACSPVVRGLKQSPLPIPCRSVLVRPPCALISPQSVRPNPSRPSLGSTTAEFQVLRQAILALSSVRWTVGLMIDKCFGYGGDGPIVFDKITDEIFFDLLSTLTVGRRVCPVRLKNRHGERVRWPRSRPPSPDPARVRCRPRRGPRGWVEISARCW